MKEQIDVASIRVYGPGIDEEVRSKQTTHFFIDAKEAGKGKLEVIMKDSKGLPVDIAIVDKLDGVYTVKYTPQFSGTYQVICIQPS